MGIINWKKWTLNKILILVTIISTITSVLFKFESCKWRGEADRYKNNYTVECSKVREYTDKNGVLVKEVSNLTLTIDDLKNSNDSTIRKLMAEVLANGDSYRKLKSINEVLMKTNAEFQTQTHEFTMFNTKDSIVIDTQVVEIDSFKNEWINYTRTRLKDSPISTVKIETYHDLILTTSWYKEGHWKIKNLWKWRHKFLKTSCKDKNPYSTIINLKVIDVKK